MNRRTFFAACIGTAVVLLSEPLPKEYLAGVVHSSIEAFDRFWDKQNEGRE